MGCCRTPDFAVSFCQEAGVRDLTSGAQAIDEVGLASAAFDSDGENILQEVGGPVRTPKDGDSLASPHVVQIAVRHQRNKAEQRPR